MKILVSWLNDYIETSLTAEQIAETLSDLGLPCEGIEYLGDDAVIDIEVTSNRGDCLGYIGVARDLSAATGKQLKLPAIELEELEKDALEFASVEILEPDLCGRYTARIIEGVKVGPSPNWLKNRLEAIGLRSVNNVVDATNYAMMETGQPPHAFDYDKLAQGKIIVRKALAGERIVSIDGTQCDLESNMLIIADAQGPVAIAGVMGGLDTEVSDSTTTILLEDAYFDPVSVRTTSRKLALPSEAAFRFERTVDIETVDWASARTCQLITQVAGGRIAKGVVDVYPQKPSPKKVKLRLSRLNKLLGIEISAEESFAILTTLGFKPKINNDLVICSVPSWRSDIYREVDLIEEVSRVHGYNKIPTQRKIEIEAVPPNPRQKAIQAIGAYLNSCGFYETVTVGFVERTAAELFAQTDDKEYLSITDETRQSANLLRQSLLGSLLGVLKSNHNVGNSPCRIFEIADAFVPISGKNKLPEERSKLALVSDGDIRDLRGAIEGLVKNINKNSNITFAPTELNWAEVGAQIIMDGSTIGGAGIFSQIAKQRFALKDVTPCGAELDVEALLARSSGPVQVKPIPRFPAIQRDLSIVVVEQTRWADIKEAINQKAPDELEDIRFVGIYRGQGIAPGKKSVTLSLLFRDQDGTLTHDSVDHFQANIVKNLATAVGAELRTL
jgi:phenylalanyl-tRNA synthetase beta chain